MIILKLEQSGPEWLDLRSKSVTSSDSSSIMGMNPFCDIHQLWEKKLGFVPPIAMNEKMARGQKLEPEAREILNRKTGIEFDPAVGLHDVNTWCMASLDGLSPCERFICEIKAPNAFIHELAMKGYW